MKFDFQNVIGENCIKKKGKNELLYFSYNKMSYMSIF
jgi:hypothetical protein